MPHDVLLAYEPLRTLLEPWSGRYRFLSLDDRSIGGGGTGPAAIVVDGSAPFDRAVLDRFPRLGLIAAISVGYEGIDVEWARERGIAATHARGGNHEDVADHAIGAILASRRGLITGDRMVRSGRWTRAERPVTRSIAGLRLGIVGMGRIGQAVAARAAAMRMAPIWWGPTPKPDIAWPRAASLMDLADASDVLVVAASANPATKGLISAPILNALGPEGLLVNVARGQLVDEDALITALRSGALGAAALDVFAEEPTPPDRWETVPNTILTPHSAGVTDLSIAALVDQLIANLDAFFAGGPLVTPVPELGQETPPRRALG